MSEEKSRKAPYAAWHKAVLVGCVIVAVLGTLGVVGTMVKVSGTISEYGGTIGAPYFIALFMLLFSMWLFAGLGVLLIYVAKNTGDISSRLDALALEVSERR